MSTTAAPAIPPKPANAPKPAIPPKPVNAPKPAPEPGIPESKEPTGKQPKGATVPVTIYNTFFEVEQVVEDNNLTPTQEELADHLMLHELMADETNPPLIIAEVLREAINGCTTDGEISMGPNCPNLDKYLGKLSLLVFQTQQGIRGPKPTIKGADIYGDVTIKISIPIEKLKELLGITITTPVVETPETEKAVEDLQTEMRALKDLLEQLQDEKRDAAEKTKPLVGGGVIEELEEQIRIKLKSLTLKMLNISKKIPKDTPLYTEFDMLLKDFETLIKVEVVALGINIDDIPYQNIRKELGGDTKPTSTTTPSTEPPKLDEITNRTVSSLGAVTNVLNATTGAASDAKKDIEEKKKATTATSTTTAAATPAPTPTATSEDEHTKKIEADQTAAVKAITDILKIVEQRAVEEANLVETQHTLII
jgi:hypothetical protein